MHQHPKRPIVRDFEFADAAARRDYLSLPEDVQQAFGHDFHELQTGRDPDPGNWKVLSGAGSADVRELIYDNEAGTWRAVYTLEHDRVIYMLHSFQKKSSSGISTDKADLDKVRRRRATATEHFETNYADAPAKPQASPKNPRGGKP